MIRSLADRVPVFLLIVVLGWSCVLFFGYGLLAGITLLAAVVAALGAAAVASAILMILELSDPYSGLFRMRDDVFEAITGAVGNRRANLANVRFTPESGHRGAIGVSAFCENQKSNGPLGHPRG